MIENQLSPSPGGAKIRLNVVSATIFLFLSLWLLVADVTFSAPIIIQGSISVLVFWIVFSLWFILAIVLAAVPKRFSLGISILFLVRSSFGWPLSIGMDSMTACRIADALLVLLCAAYLVASFGKKPRLRERPWMRWQHSVGLVVCWFVVGVASLPMGFLGFAKAAEAFTGDYVKLTFNGVSFTERIFEKDGQRVHLVGMVHIGDAGFYRSLNERMGTPIEGKRLILTEGVRDSKRLLPESFASGETYARLAKRFGLTLQGQGAAKAPNTTEEQIAEQNEAWVTRGVHFVNGDIDISQLPEKHLAVLVKLMDLLEEVSHGNFFPDMPEGMTDEDIYNTMTEALIKLRNDHLVSIFKEKAPGFAEVYIPWGAAHLAELESQITALGYVPVEESRRMGIDFWRNFRG